MAIYIYIYVYIRRDRFYVTGKENDERAKNIITSLTVTSINEQRPG